MRFTIAFFILLCTLFFNVAVAQLKPVTAQQIQLLLQEKGSRTAAQQKIDSRLLQAVRENRGQPMAAGVTLQSTRINKDDKGNVQVDIKANISDALITKIESLGGKIIYTSWQHHAIRAQVSLAVIETIAAYPEIKFIRPAVRSLTVGSGEFVIRTAANAIDKILPAPLLFAQRSASIRSQLENVLGKNILVTRPLAGSITSEGDRDHRADDVRNSFGIYGEGVRIGVLSDSYDALGGASADVLSGDLPGVGNPDGDVTPVTVLQDVSGGEDEGRAMLQIVHDVAPKAQLFFATADVSEAAFADNIQSLRNAPYNCDIVIDDVFYLDEPVFQDGIVAQAVNTVTASGGLYFSSAGNSGSVRKNTAGYYEGDFNDSSSAAFTFPGGSKTGTVHNFGTVAVPIVGDPITEVGEDYTLTWADPQGASSNDYDFFVVSPAGTVLSSSTNIQNGFQDPFEEISSDFSDVGNKLVVFKSSTAKKLAFAINTQRGQLQIVTTGQTSGHSSAADAFSVAATPASSPFSGGMPAGPYPNAFNSSNQVEFFSSDGPRRVFFNADGSAITPGNLLFKTNGGTLRNKPDITAADGVSTTLPGGSGLNPFYGTSAAAPHAGAIAALLKSANPALSTTQIRNILTSTALDIEGAGYDINSGFGIVQAYQAMQLLNPTPISNISLGTVTPTEGTFSNGNGIIDPGELGNLVIQLINPSLITSTKVSAILSTTTAGVTITQDSAYYGTITASNNASNTLTPFHFGVSSSVACGTTINFVLTVTFGGGGPSPKALSFTISTGVQLSTISGILGQAPPTGAGFTSTSGQQTGRISRDGTSPTCDAPKESVVLFESTGARAYHAFTFVNNSPASQCVTVTMTSPNGDSLYTAAYNNNGFVPSNPITNFLADAGFSGPQQEYSFDAPANLPFTVVVHVLNITQTSTYPYSLNVSVKACSSGPVCTPVVITNDSLAEGIVELPYGQTIAATGGSGSYNFSVSGGLPSGLVFAGDSLSGTPANAGSFPLIITAADVTGCPSVQQKDTLLVIAEPPVTYVFHGDGNWSDAFNWSGNVVPPMPLSPNSQIIIDPVPGGKCVLNVPYTLSPKTTITVIAAQSFIIQGNLTLHN